MCNALDAATTITARIILFAIRRVGERGGAGTRRTSSTLPANFQPTSSPVPSISPLAFENSEGMSSGDDASEAVGSGSATLSGIICLGLRRESRVKFKGD